MKKAEIQNLIKELIEKTTLSVKDVVITEDGPTNTWYSVEVSEPHFFTLRDGEALLALNHLVRKIIESKSPATDGAILPEASFLIDINGFQKKRVENVRAVAHMMAERARYFKSSVEVDPMSAFERRIIHEFLSDATDLKTESTGFGRDRRVIIKYIGAI
ncbi:MAG: R3H domain-containing nucleic acid-binding protein [Patescibacteria group bacterium]